MANIKRADKAVSLLLKTWSRLSADQREQTILYLVRDTSVGQKIADLGGLPIGPKDKRKKASGKV